MIREYDLEVPKVETLEECDGATLTLITEYLAALELELTRHFPEISSQTFWLLRDPSTAPETFIPDDNDAAHTELMGLQEDSGAKMKFDTETLSVLVNDGSHLP